MTKHPHDPQAFMREIRRLLRAAGHRPGDAGFVVWLGHEAYSAVCDWLQDDVSPTAQTAPIFYGSSLSPAGIVVERRHGHF